MSSRIALLGSLALLSAPAALSAQRPTAPAPAIPENAFDQLRYRFIGPEGNRVASVAGVPGDPQVYYAGAASGGIFKTTDGGIHWQPIFDAQPVSSIGALAVAPSDPNIVWAGTGEPWIRSHISVGWGVYKSTDAGKTWALMGLQNPGRLSRVIVHPTNPRILFAGMWQIEIHTWGRESGGAGSGLYTSRDGGTTWRKLSGNGLPSRTIGKFALGIARTNPNRIYALIETGDGAPWRGQPTDRGKFWRSDDGGEQWQLVSYDRQLGGRTAYYNRIAVSPDNENEVYFLTAAFSKTLDGGRTTLDQGGAQSPGGDNHEMWIDPTNGNRMAVANDGGISISINRGRSWHRIQPPIAQMYHVTVDNRIPYFVMGNQQDNPSARGPSNSKTGGFGGGGISRGMWHSVGGGESGWATPDPENPDLVWSSASGSGSRGGIVVRYDVKSGTTRNVEVWPQSTGGWPAADLKYRFVWTAPLTISPHDHNKLYIGSQHVHVTTNGGESWQVISPDLTRNDKSRQQISGGLTPDNIGVEYAGVVFAIAESRLTPGLIWAGTNDGLVQLTQDGGKTWTNLTPNLTGLLNWGTISNIEASRYDAGTAYLSVDGHQVNNRDPWIYKTTDYGKTWKLIVSGIPRSPLSYVHVVREDPVRRGLLYAGTENGLYVSFNDGESWQPLQTNLPHAPVYWLVIQEHFNDLVVATYGRGFWILDDITPLQQLTPELAAREVQLLAPRPAYRFRTVESPYAMSDDPSAGQNPQYGASIHYWLKNPAEAVTLTIQDAGGKVVRTLRGSGGAGLNRIMWDLRFEPTRQSRQRTSPLFAPEIVVEQQGRPMPDGGTLAILAPPGNYTVKLRAGGQEQTQPLVVRKDPSSGGSEEDIRSQTALLQELSNDINGVVDMINTIESARSQLVSLRSVLGNDAATAPVRLDADSLERKLIAVEEELAQLRITGRGQDGVRWPIKLHGQMLYLGAGVSSSDWKPTAQQVEVRTLLAEQARATRGRLTQLLERDLAAFNARLRERNLPNVLLVP